MVNKALQLQSLASDLVKKACAFIVRVDMPVETLQLILRLMSNRKIVIESLQMHAEGGGEATLILHCLVEKDRVKYSQQILQKTQGVMGVEVLESKGYLMAKVI